MAHTVLHINSSPLGDHSVSRKLTENLLTELKKKHPDTLVITRDLVSSPLPHLSDITVGAFFTPPEQRNDALNAALVLSDELIDELFAADVIVIGAPMWNFGIPSSLKAWIDHVARAGRTFTYGAAGPESLLPPGKKVIIASARGGIYSSGPMKVMDHQESYLRAILGFIGLHDVSIIRAEGVAMGEEAKQAALGSAGVQLDEAITHITT
ncbi:FMN-dependent NADH-azoreductase [Methylobacillus gramineus]|uniref:FMN-dependent NADH-azoreductase n=1 Tax=Methylobacillus gramineus TaxID=755169 RepID=UPI001D0009A5|nr:FMN-dependent NADH-azoreductase [Methylobacillus gramineus]MCB5185891.1 FMN-dependent NADH-azoreductase [Methylobacillus gramineus]